ncbi:MAG: hypothetical protein IKB16_06530 [Lentisphaeria bacterium]|nr:hypothetical protein [Lentisphaeria bacterium]
METNVSNALAEYIQNGMTIGLIGVGKFGLELREYLAARYELTFLLCDPPRLTDDSDELCDALREVWGNGMGGCDFSKIQTETFLPLEQVVKKADILLVQVPYTENGPWKTDGMLTADLLSLAEKAVSIINFSDFRVIAPDAIEYCLPPVW